MPPYQFPRLSSCLSDDFPPWVSIVVDKGLIGWFFLSLCCMFLSDMSGHRVLASIANTPSFPSFWTIVERTIEDWSAGALSMQSPMPFERRTGREVTVAVFVQTFVGSYMFIHVLVEVATSFEGRRLMAIGASQARSVCVRARVWTLAFSQIAWWARRALCHD